MDPDLIRLVFNAVKEYLNLPTTHPTNTRSQPDRVFRFRHDPDFVNLLVHLRKTLLVPDTHAEVFRLHMIAAASVLGPQDAGPPPVDYCETLARLIEETVDESAAQLKRCYEIAVAFGVGWGRDVDHTSSGWAAIWPNARHTLARSLPATFRRLARQLPFKVIGFGTPEDLAQFKFGEDGAPPALAYQVIDPLINPEYRVKLDSGGRLRLFLGPFGLEIDSAFHKERIPEGRKAVFRIEGAATELRQVRKQAVAIAHGSKVIVSVYNGRATIKILNPDGAQRVTLGLDDTVTLQGALCVMAYKCSCSWRRCEEKHRIQRWNPGVCDLWSFLANAIKGPNTPRDPNPPEAPDARRGPKAPKGPKAPEARKPSKTEIVTGSLVQSVLFGGGFLRRVRLVQVDYTECPRTKRRLDPDMCRTCDRTCDPLVLPRKITSVLMRMGVDSGFREESLIACRHCKGVFSISNAAIVRSSLCSECKNPIITDVAKIKEIFQATSLLKKVRLLVRERNQQHECQHCHCVLKPVVMCPVCANEDKAFAKNTYGGLSERFTHVWTKSHAGFFTIPGDLMNDLGFLPRGSGKAGRYAFYHDSRHTQRRLRT